jgi:hypothetical protein
MARNGPSSLGAYIARHPPGGARRLAPYRVSKGTIRCPLSEPVPARSIARIAKILAREAADGTAARRARPKKRG